MTITSPSFPNGAQCDRTPQDVLDARATRKSFMASINRGADDLVRKVIRAPDRCCPFCGSEPPLAAKIAGKFIVGCESEDCAANPQVSGLTIDEAWLKWNGRA